MTNKICLSIEGNIGAGKSTLLALLEKHYGKDNIEFITEPVEQWRHCHGENLLEAFYSDPKKYAYMFQSVALSSRLILQSVPQIKPIRILERSAMSDHCFAKNCHINGLIDDKEYAAYESWYSFLLNHIDGKPNAIIYLRTTPETCYKRIDKRNRHEENSVSLEYLKQLHTEHECWLPLTSNFDTLLNLPFVVIDGNQEFEHCEETQRKILDDIQTMIDNL